MNDIPRDQLIEIIKQHGQDVIKTPQRVKGLLMDSCGECEREIHALMTALDKGIPSNLCMPGNIPPKILIPRLTRTLLNKSSMADDLAQWAVESWAIALGVISTGQGTQPSPVPRSVQSRPAPAAPPAHKRVWIPARMVKIGLVLIGLGGGLFFIFYNFGIPGFTPALLAPKMVIIPAGSFQMGSEQGDQNERPVHAVTLDAFQIDLYEVTNGNYAKCVAEGECQQPSDTSSYYRWFYYNSAWYVNYPVVNVTWDQAKTYCEWRKARLPNEAEWEKAARGGLEGKMYPWGDESPVCVPGAKDGAQVGSCSIRDTIAVGTFKPNGYGLYDMAGNVWEWVNDWYGDYASSAVTNPTGPASGEHRLLRGGSWGDNQLSSRVAVRYNVSPDYRFDLTGFRCAASPP